MECWRSARTVIGRHLSGAAASVPLAERHRRLAVTTATALARSWSLARDPVRSRSLGAEGPTLRTRRGAAGSGRPLQGRPRPERRSRRQRFPQRGMADRDARSGCRSALRLSVKKRERIPTFNKALPARVPKGRAREQGTRP